MKFSDILIPWKEHNYSKNNNKLSSHSSEDNSITQKKKFVQSALNNPEFDQTISDVKQMVLEHSNQKEQAIMTAILDKIEAGELEYDDLSSIEKMYENNYKYLFHDTPESTPRGTWTSTAIILISILGLIILRIAYSIENSSTLLLFISIINIIANAYTFLHWPLEVTAIIEKWLQNNNIKTATRNKMLGEVARKIWIISFSLLVILIIWLLICYFALSCYELGTDIVSIIALGISITNNQIIKLMATHFEKNIYYNK